MRYPKRLIEVDLPIKRISAHARRDKYIRHGHISTLHKWWARRPLAACRAVICASLWPDPADDLCPDMFRKIAREQMMKWAKNHLPLLSGESMPRFVAISKNERKLDDLVELRAALLDFIADFANWDSSTVPEYLKTSRLLTQAAHEALGGEPGSRPLVVDPFAGGGAIPLEALRVGADAFASDLNPVAVLLNKVVLEYIPKYGRKLVDEVRKWGQWIKEQAEKELAEFYPKDADGAIPIAYLWARTILSESPGEEKAPVEVPLIRSLWLAKKTGRKRALRWVRDDQDRVRTETVEVTYENGTTRSVRRPLLEIFKPKKDAEVEPGTVARGSATCPVTGFTTPVARVREQLKTRQGGTNDARLFCVVIIRPGMKGRFYRSPTVADWQAVRSASEELERRKHEHIGDMSLVPDESNTEYQMFNNSAPIYGIKTWGSLFTQRQMLALTSLVRLVRKAGRQLAEQREEELTRAVQTCLGLVTNKVAQHNSSLCRWTSTGENIADTFGRQAFPMVWDFSEAAPMGGASGDILAQIDWHVKALEGAIKATGSSSGQIELASATIHPLPNDSAQGFITDPPYYYSVQYAGLSDFFYIWLKRSLGNKYPDLFRTHLAPKEDEIVVSSPTQAKAHNGKNNIYYEKQMCIALNEGRRICCHDGIGVIVFAQLQTSAWEAFIHSLVDAGWTITASWPIDTEMSSRIIAARQSVLGSSIHIVCRPRENPDGSLRTDDIGDWRDVLQELPKRIHDWMPRLAKEGVVGADAIFACLGPALEIFSQYTSVEKASGEQVTLKEYLEYVWAAVAKEALNIIFEGADATGFEEDARFTAMWLWTLGFSSADFRLTNEDVGLEKAGHEENQSQIDNRQSQIFCLEYDAARKIAQGLGTHLERLVNLVEVKGDKARLFPVSERTQHLFGKDSAQERKGKRKKKDKQRKFGFMADLEEVEQQSGWDEKSVPSGGKTVLDRLHQCMILFAAGRGETLKRFLVEEGIGRDQRFWRLAQALSALYPPNVDEKRWVDGVLARKKSLGF